MISWKLKPRGLRPIGLDIGHDSIKMIQLAVNDGCISILAADKVRIETGINGDEKARRSFVVSAIKRMLSMGKFHGRNVVSCLPNDKVKITGLRLAEALTGEIEQTLRKEADRRFGFNSQDDIINYLVAGNVQDGDEVKNELILFAVSGETIRNHIAMIEESRLIPVAIDTVPYALFRNFERSRRREEDKDQTVVFVDVGSKFTTVVFGRGEEITFVKQIPLGGEKFNSEVATKLGVGIGEAEILREKLQMEIALKEKLGPSVLKSNSLKQDKYVSILQAGQDGNALDAATRAVIVDAIGAVAEELAKGILLCLRYYTVAFRGEVIKRVVISGGEAYERILLDVLRRHLSAKIEVAQPLKGLEVKNIKFDDKRRLLCEWAVAVGLSLKGCEGR